MVVFKTLGKSGPSPESMKKKQKRSETPTIIRVEDSVYELPWTTLRNMALDFYDEVEALSASRGQDDAHLMLKNCLQCNYNPRNVFVVCIAGGKVGHDCKYAGQKGIESTQEYTERDTRKKFYAKAQPCVIEEAMIEVLKNKGLLEKFKSDKSFDFRPLEDFENGKVKPDDFPSPRIPLKSRLLDLLGL